MRPFLLDSDLKTVFSQLDNKSTNSAAEIDSSMLFCCELWSYVLSLQTPNSPQIDAFSIANRNLFTHVELLKILLLLCTPPKSFWLYLEKPSISGKGALLVNTFDLKLLNPLTWSYEL